MLGSSLGRTLRLTFLYISSYTKAAANNLLMMTCRCTTNTLRLFIRSVAQVDLPSATTFSTRFPQNPIRDFRSTRAVRAQPVSCRTFSSAAVFRSGAARCPEGTQDTGDEAGTSSTGNWDAADAVVELSPNSINAIAAEATETSYGEAGDLGAPFKIPRQDLPQRRARDKHQLPDQIIRRSKPENTGFSLHYSNRRPPVDHESKLDPRLQSAASVANLARGGFRRGGREKQRDLQLKSASAMNSLREQLAEEDQREWTPPKRETWQIDKEARVKKYPDGWNPLRRLSPDAMAGIRALHNQMPDTYTTEVLANEFKVSPEAIRRILKSKWRPNSEEETDRQQRWFRRGENAWGRFAEMGMKPPRQWRELGIGKGRPEWMLRKREAAAAERARAPLAALLTTSKRKESVKDKTDNKDEAWSENLSDRIL